MAFLDAGGCQCLESRKVLRQADCRDHTGQLFSGLNSQNLECNARSWMQLGGPTNQTDGLRATFANGDIVHLRPSGNAPELRCYAEADSAERAKLLCDACLARISAL